MKALLPALLCLALAAGHAALPDAQRQIEMTLQQYGEAKTDAQRAAIAEYLQQLGRPAVIAAVVAHIEQAQTGPEATLYNGLIDGLRPDSCAEVVRALRTTEQAEHKAKLVVALRHCQGAEVNRALAAVLSDKRPVAFEAHGKAPRRVCDLAYDELFLKLRGDPKYGLDASARMKGIIREATPVRQRDALIRKLTDKMAASEATPTPKASATPAKP